MTRTRPLGDRFWTKVDKTVTCWLWLGGISADGYGQFSINGRRRPTAHRFAYELLVGPIPPGLEIDHLCRVRHCVNPAHLEAVTHSENFQRGHTSGALHYRAVLTDEEVEELRAAYRVGDVTQDALALRFGMSQGGVANILRGARRKAPMSASP